MSKVSVLVACVAFMLGAITGNAMGPRAAMQVAKDQSQSIFELQRNAPANLVVQQFDAV